MLLPFVAIEGKARLTRWAKLARHLKHLL